jgi:hypothetical protein
MTVSAALAAPTGLLRAGNALTDAVPQVAGVILMIFLLLAIGFVIAAYAEATARRIKPRIVITKERPDNEIGNAAGAVFLLALLVAVAMLMDHGF